MTTWTPVAAVNAALMASMPAFSPGSEWLLPTCSEPPSDGATDAAVEGATDAAPDGAADAAVDGAAVVGDAVAAVPPHAAMNAETPPSAATAAPPLSTSRRETERWPRSAMWFLLCDAHAQPCAGRSPVDCCERVA